MTQGVEQHEVVDGAVVADGGDRDAGVLQLAGRVAPTKSGANFEKSVMFYLPGGL